MTTVTIPNRPTSRTGLIGYADVSIPAGTVAVTVETLDYDGNTIAAMSYQGPPTTPTSHRIAYSNGRKFAHAIRVMASDAAGGGAIETQAVTPFVDIPHYLELAGPGFTYDSVKTAPGVRRYKRLHLKMMRDRGIRHVRLRMVSVVGEDWNVDRLWETTNPADENNATGVMTKYIDHVIRVIKDCLREDVIPILAFDPAALEETPTNNRAEVDRLLTLYRANWNRILQVIPNSLLLSINPWIEVGHYQAERPADTNAFYASVLADMRSLSAERIMFAGSPALSDPTALDLLQLPSIADDPWIGAEWHAFAAGANYWRKATSTETPDETDTFIPWAANTAIAANQLVRMRCPSNSVGIYFSTGTDYLMRAPAAMTTGAVLDVAEWQRYKPYSQYSQYGWAINVGHVKFWPADRQSPKITPTERARGNDLVRQKFAQGRAWQVKTGRSTYFGAVLASNYVQSVRFSLDEFSPDHTLAEQAQYAALFMQTAKNYGVPSVAWNSDDRYLNPVTDQWRPESAAVLDAIVAEYTAAPQNAIDLAGTAVKLEGLALGWPANVTQDTADVRDLLWVASAGETVSANLAPLAMYVGYTFSFRLMSGPAGGTISATFGSANQSVAAGASCSIAAFVDRPVTTALRMTASAAGTYRLRLVKVV